MYKINLAFRYRSFLSKYYIKRIQWTVSNKKKKKQTYTVQLNGQIYFSISECFVPSITVVITMSNIAISDQSHILICLPLLILCTMKNKTLFKLEMVYIQKASEVMWRKQQLKLQCCVRTTKQSKLWNT